MGVIIISRALIALFSTIIAWCGLQWHIGFTIQNRYTWGLRGSYIPLLQRILLNFIWTAVQCTPLPHSFNRVKLLTQHQAGMEADLLRERRNPSLNNEDR
jgi:purine-cytosine permease-like protein